MPESDGDATTRTKIADALRTEPHTATDISEEIGIPRAAAYDHLEHVAQSVDSNDADEQFLVAPPECRECGFSAFDDLINYPSRCPECRSERIEEPAFVIQ
ncbi:transcriptional regulator [Halopelagius fulvigenes]|uniref:Transcriptional regulator n=1 Tax=Halopelagius fulvigenes TaxID=1198324 RepID=A0ABD5TZT9_9EURY